MPIQTDLDVAPFFDDYSANSQYYRILFRPAVAVQARELTQTQSILQNQIENFGNWAFQNGDIVSGCTIIDIPVLPFARLQDFQTNTSAFDITQFVNTQVVSATSNLTAKVFLSNTGLVANYPNTNVIYIQYINTGNNGATAFGNNETLWFFSTPTNTPTAATANAIVNTYATPNSTAVSTGNAHGISVSNGVVFINGTFVNVLQPTYGVVNAYGTYAGNNLVGFQVTENIINENQDPSLLDNALGYTNENAPGAYRLQLLPGLVSLDPVTAANTQGFNPIATYSYGGLIAKQTAGFDVHSAIGEAIAERIYDEAGNYVVNPFVVDTVTSTTGNSIVSSIDANTVLGRIYPGVGYAQGQRVELLKTAYIQMRRGVDTQSYSSQQITFNYGNYLSVNEVAGNFPFQNAQTVHFYDAPQAAVTSGQFSSLSTANGNFIGTGTLRNFSYNAGIPGTNTANYYIHLYNIKMNSGFQVNQIKSLIYGSFYSNNVLQTANGVADVISNGLVATNQKDQLYTFGQPGLKSLRDGAGNLNTQYTYRISNTGTLSNTSGSVSFTVAGSQSGGYDILPYGLGTLASSDAANFTLVATANGITSALGGSVDISSTNTYVNGHSSSFLTDFTPGDSINVGGVNRTVNNIINSTAMYVNSAFTSTSATQTYYKAILAGRLIPFNTSASGVPSGNVTVTNVNLGYASFTINTNLTNLTAPLPVTAFYDVLRYNTTPAKKIINKNRFVQINLANNVNGLTGPWTLGFSDVHKVSAIYGSSTGTWVANATSGIVASNITNQFSFDTGQKDTHYDLARIYPNAGFNANAYPYLLVQLDYFTTNTTPGVGFYTVESYPIDDANTANTTAIQTKDIPLYVDQMGNKVWLRDYVDFRTPAVSTANNTGTCDTSNNAQIQTAVGYVTINPSANVTFNIPAGGINSPSYGKNLQSNFTIYLSRSDLITITPDNTIKVVEGVSSVKPQTPIFPSSSMTLAVLNIPPYPSLSTDQVDSDQALNALSKNLVRDTSTAISTNLVSNRRYTMNDIGKLDTRISNLEYYTQLSLLQQQATNLTVTNAQGLNRFKNGIFVDSFNDFTQSAVSDPEYNIAIDQKQGQARPKFVLQSFRANFNSSVSSNVVQTGRAVTLAYTSNSFITQPYATKYRSSAHVASQWHGNITLFPSYNDDINYNNTASVGITINNATPWQQFANTPFGSIWGGWQSTVNTVSTSVTTGTVNTYNVELGYQYTQSSSAQALNAAIAAYQAAGYTIGGTSLSFTGQHGGIGSNASITQVS